MSSKVVDAIERIGKDSGYSFKFLVDMFFECALGCGTSVKNEDEILKHIDECSRKREWGTPGEFPIPKRYSDETGESNIKIKVDTTKLEKACDELRRSRRIAASIRERIADTEAESIKMREQPAITTVFDHMTGKISYVDPETSKIRKHTHDILWAVLAGFTACGILSAGLVLLIIGVLSYARG